MQRKKEKNTLKLILKDFLNLIETKMSNSLSQVIENCSQKNLLNFLDIWLLIEIFFIHKASMFVIKN